MTYFTEDCVVSGLRHAFLRPRFTTIRHAMPRPSPSSRDEEGRTLKSRIAKSAVTTVVEQELVIRAPEAAEAFAEIKLPFTKPVRLKRANIDRVISHK